MKTTTICVCVFSAFLISCSKPKVEQSSAAPNTTPDVKKMDYALPVKGKPGFVTSPYSPKAGYVDVRGFPKNTQVKDPYSEKIFLVPETDPPTAPYGSIQKEIQKSPKVDDPTDKNVSY